jgi:hypothetical protein
MTEIFLTLPISKNYPAETKKLRYYPRSAVSRLLSGLAAALGTMPASSAKQAISDMME